MTAKSVGAYKLDYPWAINKIKLAEAIKDLEEMQQSDKSIVIDEPTIKMRYADVRKGEILKSPEDLENDRKAAKAKRIQEAKDLIASEESGETDVDAEPVEATDKKAPKKTKKSDSKDE